tara:strand:+ start:3062 stop:3913 length:852 start_codon:yes stop_codon:yes gene_type:complete
MILTNKYGAPDAVIKAVEDDSYSMGDADFSVTGLIQPPQIARLRKEHEDKISEDVRDQIWKLVGTGVHEVLAKNNPGTVEKRFFAAHPYGVRISGAIDLLEDNGAVTDYKVTSVYTLQNALKADWEAQLNIYAWLLRQNDIKATSLTIVGIARDWMRSRSNRQVEYPQSPIVSIPVPMWLPDVQDEYVNSRVTIHTAEDTVPCTNSERWARGGYKTVSPGGKAKKFNSLSDAAMWVNKHKTASLKVVDQTPQYVRCESWCDVSDFCPQWRGGGNRGKERPRFR